MPEVINDALHAHMDLTLDQVPGRTEDDVKTALMAMASNKNQTAAPASTNDDDDDEFFG